MLPEHYCTRRDRWRQRLDEMSAACTILLQLAREVAVAKDPGISGAHAAFLREAYNVIRWPLSYPSVEIGNCVVIGESVLEHEDHVRRFLREELDMAHIRLMGVLDNAHMRWLEFAEELSFAAEAYLIALDKVWAWVEEEPVVPMRRSGGQSAARTSAAAADDALLDLLFQCIQLDSGQQRAIS